MLGQVHADNSDEAYTGNIVWTWEKPQFIPLPGTVLRLCKNTGDTVAAGEVVMIVESMKMESYVYAPYDGTVTEIVVESGENVAAFQPLVRVNRKED